MNSKRINRYVLFLTLSLCVGVIGFSTLSGQTADPSNAARTKQPRPCAPGEKPPCGEWEQPFRKQNGPPIANVKPCVPCNPGCMKDDCHHLAGKVISQSGNTFTILANGEGITFSAAKLATPPKVGEILEIGYTKTPGGRLEAMTVKVNASRKLPLFSGHGSKSDSPTTFGPGRVVLVCHNAACCRANPNAHTSGSWELCSSL